METITFLIIILFAGFVQGVAGFGFGLVAVSILSLVMDLQNASISLVFCSLSINLLISWRLREHFKLERVLPMLLSTFVGVPLGLMLLIKADINMLKKLLAIILILTVINKVYPIFKSRRWHPVWLGIPCGLFSGALAGTFATGGPPIVAYVSNQKFNKLRYVVTIQLILGISAIIRLILLLAGGKLEGKLLINSLAGIAAALAGALIGLKILDRINQKYFTRFIIALLTLMAIMFLF